MFLLSIALASGGAALSLWLERALAGLPSPFLEINWGNRFHVIWFSCYVINGHEGGQNMANHVSIFIVKSASTKGPGRGGTSYLADFDETWPV